MRPDEGQEELEEVQAELKKKDEEVCSINLYCFGGYHNQSIFLIRWKKKQKLLSHKTRNRGSSVVEIV